MKKFIEAEVELILLSAADDILHESIDLEIPDGGVEED